MPNSAHVRTRIVSLVLLLAWPTLVLHLLNARLFGQTPVGGLRIAILRGDNLVVDDTHSPEILVQVQDSRAVPITGVDVTFSMPESGAGGLFGASKRLVVKTDSEGRASSGLIRPGETKGGFTVNIQAALQGQTATTSATLTNGAPGATSASNAPQKGSSKKWIVILVGVGAAVGVLLATRKKSGSDSGAGAGGPTGTITIGNPTVGQPQ